MPTEKPQAAPAPRKSILWRIISQALVLTAFIIVVLTTLSYIIARTIHERAIQTQLSSVVSLAEDALEGEVQANRERASLLASHADIKAVIAGQAESPTLERLLADLRASEQSLLSMEVYSVNGTLLAQAGDAIGLPPEALGAPLSRPVVSNRGWDFYTVFIPVRSSNGQQIGVLALKYDAMHALTPLLTVAPLLGETAEVLLSYHDQGSLLILHPSFDRDDSYVLSFGESDSSAIDDAPLYYAASGQEGVMRSVDYRGRDTLSAYRYLPTLGWGLAVRMEREAALKDIRRLATSHASIGTLILLLAAALASLLAHQVTAPLRQLTEKVRLLRPGHWKVANTVHTKDEVEVLDRVVVDMASRLRRVYEHQEEEIQARTHELHKQYALDRAILENVDYGLVTVDRKGLITGINPAAASMLALEREAQIGRAAEEILLFCGHAGNPLPGMRPVRECLETGEAIHSPANGRINIQRKDATLLPVMFAVTPLREGTKIFGAIVAFQDITEERRIDYLKSEFISLASHQLRTPLAAIRWYVELFLDEKKLLSDEQRSYLKEMDHALRRMVVLLNSLLHTARLEDNDVQPTLQSVDVASLLQEAGQDCQSLVASSGIKCNLRVPSRSVHMTTDPTLLQIVLQNLLTNAVKYSKGKKAHSIHIQLKEGKTRIQLIVQDEGIGIPKAEQKRVFQKFFRAKNVRKMDTDGNGLGLYIAHSIVQRLGGTITFKSEEDKGTTFTVTLPKVSKSKEKK